MGDRTDFLFIYKIVQAHGLRLHGVTSFERGGSTKLFRTGEAQEETVDKTITLAETS